MRHPLRQAGICCGLTLLGVALVLLVTAKYDQLGQVAGLLIGMAAVSLAGMSFLILLWALLAAFGHARLLAGKGVIARWHVSPAEWERFRAFDAIRAAQDLSLRNSLRIRQTTPPGGVDVIVGRRQVMIDGSYEGLRGVLRAVSWLPAPADPECLEFAVRYPRGRSGGTLNLSLRIPVPASARSEGVRVFEHYRAVVPQRRLRK